MKALAIMFRFPLKHAMPISLALVVSACATQDQSRLVDAAATPLNDLNLVQIEIPDLLVIAQKQPYAVPNELDCASLTALVKELDIVLGPDIDAPKSKAKADLLEKGTKEGKDAAVGVLRRTAEGVVPFRSWIRKLTGAERRSKKVAAAIAAGSARRAFIKGLGVSNACVWYLPPPIDLNPEPEAAPQAEPNAIP